MTTRSETLDPIAVLKKRLETCSMRALAREFGISAAYVSDVMAGRRDPGPAILEPLGIESVTTVTRTYRKRKAKQ